MRARLRRAGACVMVAATLAAAIIPSLRPEDVPIAEHHLFHAGIILLAVVAAALVVGGPSGAREQGSGLWLVPVVAAPLAMMFLMWPSTYDYLDTHPLAHALDHIGLAVLGFAGAYGGQRYVRGVGWLVGLATVGMAVIAAGGFGFAPPTPKL
ncbi:hypothetical protein EPN44_08835 [bacterium]|nr:MAG: hypothetical protein EPN44_08835 [bacterium]